MPPLRDVRLVLVAALVMISVAGCTSLSPENTLTNQSHLIDDLVQRLQIRLAEPGPSGYTATYELAGTGIGQVAQVADRTAYRYPGGVVLLSAKRTTTCVIARTTSCVYGNPPVTVAPLLAAATRAGFLSGPTLISLLSMASEHPTWLTGQSDSTIAGRPATCVTIKRSDPVEEYAACVTADGVVGSFTGTADGIKIDCHLSDYRDSTADDAFAMPPGAVVSDVRTPQA